MVCLSCGQEHTSVVCPTALPGDFTVNPEPIFREPYVAPMFNWLPVDYTEKLDRIIELLEELVPAKTEDVSETCAPPSITTEFECPWCGGHTFGTKGSTGDWNKAIGHCHGKKCKFTWLRIDDEFHGFFK